MTRAHKKKSPRKASRSTYASKVTSKYQTTIPKEIRKHLHIKRGDQIMYELFSDDTVVLRKTSPLDIEYLRAVSKTLSEWNSDEDENAYKDL
jgi:antitoxin PrlF